MNSDTSFPVYFREIRPSICLKLEKEPNLTAKTIFEELHQKKPNKFVDGQLRTLQRKVKVWKDKEQLNVNSVFDNLKT